MDERILYFAISVKSVTILEISCIHKASAEMNIVSWGEQMSGYYKTINKSDQHHLHELSENTMLALIIDKLERKPHVEPASTRVISHYKNHCESCLVNTNNFKIHH